MNARLFDVLHNAGDQNIFAIAQSIHIDLSRILEESIDEHRARLRERHGFTHVLSNRVFLIRDHHGPAAENVTGSNQHRESEPASDITASCSLVAVPFAGDGI